MIGLPMMGLLTIGLGKMELQTIGVVNITNNGGAGKGVIKDMAADKETTDNGRHQ